MRGTHQYLRQDPLRSGPDLPAQDTVRTTHQNAPEGARRPGRARPTQEMVRTTHQPTLRARCGSSPLLLLEGLGLFPPAVERQIARWVDPELSRCSVDPEAEGVCIEGQDAA